jgi:formate hydrogenlyase subunit 3/multisubunit Na+/H+ antiporter MnhD subunit
MEDLALGGILAGGGILLLSGLCALLPVRYVRRTQAFATILAAVLGLGGTLAVFPARSQKLDLAWGLPLGSFSVGVDALSAIFLVLVFLISALGAVWSWGNGPSTSTSGGEKRLAVSWAFLAGGMVLVTVARDAVLFLMAWEIMALAAYFAATADSSNRAAQRSGWVYLVATHAGTLALFLMFALWKFSTGSWDLATSGDLALAGPIFGLALLGFGFKAGLVPLHFWLPDTHANAPSHVSALMSGVMLKMGIYGILRMAVLLGGALDQGWSWTVLGIGALTALLGIAFALPQRDLKRFLAFSSVENIGLITMGLGLALLGRSLGSPVLVLFGLGGALFHVLNHGLFKPLLFLSSGNVAHAVGSRNIETMGGLAHKMPLTAIFFLTGTLAITALFPLNGFASEFLLYLGFFHGFDSAVSLGVVVVATVGALALAGFVKIYATIFLGSRRVPNGEVHEVGLAQLVSLAVLAAACLSLGLFPGLVFSALDQAVRIFWPALSPVSTLAGSGILSWTWEAGLGLVSVALVLALIYGLKKSPRKLTWDCGYVRPTARMQYSGGSFTAPLVKLLSFALFPHERPVSLGENFPSPAKHRTSTPDPLLDRLIRPAARRFYRLAHKVHWFQRGRTQLYLVQILAFLLILLVGSLYL